MRLILDIDPAGPANKALFLLMESGNRIRISECRTGTHSGHPYHGGADLTWSVGAQLLQQPETRELFVALYEMESGPMGRTQKNRYFRMEDADSQEPEFLEIGDSDCPAGLIVVNQL